MAEKKKDEKKIIIDEDWKAEAQKEKEGLAKEADLEKKEKEAAEKQAAEHPQQLPDADFSGLVSMLTTQAFFAMGVIRTEADQDTPTDFAMAKYNIDMLGVIEEKTKANISDDEAKLLQSALHQLRMVFVKVTSEPTVQED